MTAGTNKEADIATPTSERTLSPNTDSATPAPDSNAIKTPTHKLRVVPLKEEYKVVKYYIQSQRIDKPRLVFKKRLHGEMLEKC